MLEFIFPTRNYIMFTSLRRQLILICVTIVALSMLAVVFVNFYTVRTHTLEALDRQVFQLAEVHAAGITEWVASKRAAVASMKPAAQMADPMPVVKAVEQAGGFDPSYLGFADKRLFTSQERKLPPNFDPTVRPWYVKAAQAGAPVITAPYADASSGKLVVTFADPVGPKGATTAVAGADISLNVVVANVNSLKPTPNSYAFLFDNVGTIIAHPDPALTLKPVGTVGGGISVASLAATESSAASSQIMLAGRESLLYVTKVEGTDWSLATVVDRAEATQALSSMVTSSALTALAGVVLAALALAMLVRRALVDFE
ncbi:MAG TPA: hypothetical protein DCW29_19760 [Janthinobacterium sp.]|nr:hypothetical protein [Janthinobacterium sp.]